MTTTPPKDATGRFVKRDPEKPAPATTPPATPPAPSVPTGFVVALVVGVILLVVGRK